MVLVLSMLMLRLRKIEAMLLLMPRPHLARLLLLLLPWIARVDREQRPRLLRRRGLPDLPLPPGVAQRDDQLPGRRDVVQPGLGGHLVDGDAVVLAREDPLVQTVDDLFDLVDLGREELAVRVRLVLAFLEGVPGLLVLEYFRDGLPLCFCVGRLVAGPADARVEQADVNAEDSSEKIEI